MMKTTTIQGTQAAHTITINPEPLTNEGWEAEFAERGLSDWNKPESGEAADAGFKTAGKAQGWLTKSLRKAGWPRATQWEVRQWLNTSNNWHVFEVDSRTPRKIFK